jgi:D-lactate dehydratase
MPVDRKIWEDEGSEFRKRLDKGLTPADVNWQSYSIFFASAGHAALIDYPTAEGLQNIAGAIFDAGRVVAAVCHGGAMFPGIISKTTMKSIIDGKRVTGFMTKGEEELNVLEVIRGWEKPTLEAAAAAAGATCKCSPRPCHDAKVLRSQSSRCPTIRSMGRLHDYRWADRDRR